MKRILSLILALVLVCGLVPAARAAGGAVSSNLDGHWYVNAERWATPIYSHLAYENGEYVRVECLGDELVVEYYDQNFKFRSGKTIPLELSIRTPPKMGSSSSMVLPERNLKSWV